ncbi:MAG: glycosyltransferase family 4 protein [Eubacteriales bacterium]|nr:glycosyltransferase family 4 protein [Eubacteriales bacterium]
MKILYSAYECNPGIGSDAYVGWSWAKEMSRDNEVHVLTNDGNRNNIEKYIECHRDQSATFHYVHLPSGLKKALKGRKGYFASYVIWQWFAYRYAKKLNGNNRFDIVHHVSIADFRIIGFLWKLDIPFIFGPVGGGQETPAELKYYVRNYSINEFLRSMINSFSLSMPVYKRGIKKAAKVFVSNDETIQVMKMHLGEVTGLIRMCELGVDSDYLNQRTDLVHQKSDKVHVLVSGRLMYRKGIELLLDALTVLNTENDFVVDFYGGGHQSEEVKQQIFNRKLQNKVILHGKVSFEEMQKVYANSDILALPSLRETTGTAVIEAMANKIPVVALNQNGVKYLVQKDCGLLVEIKSREETIADFSYALKTLIENYELRIDLGNNGFRRLRSEYTWEKKCNDMLKIYKTMK